MTSAAYIRVSSKAQNYDTQHVAIQRAAAAKGDVIGETYAEKRSAAKAATAANRPELARLRADARLGKFRRLYVFRLDRFTRSGIRDTLEVIQELQGHGVEVISLTDGFDLTGPFSEVIIAVMAWAARMELLAKNERIAAARERLEAEGRTWGRPKRMTPEQIERARRMAAQGRSVRAIAIALKVAKTTIGRALSASPQGSGTL